MSNSIDAGDKAMGTRALVIQTYFSTCLKAKFCPRWWDWDGGPKGNVLFEGGLFQDNDVTRAWPWKKCFTWSSFWLVLKKKHHKHALVFLCSTIPFWERKKNVIVGKKGTSCKWYLKDFELGNIGESKK